MIKYKGKYTTAIVMVDSIEPTTVQQIYVFINHPAFTNPVVVMPDCHAGKGAVIGFTMELTDVVIPNVIGVDINCGMLSFEIEDIDLDWADDEMKNKRRAEIDREIRKAIPFGTSVHTNATYAYKIAKFPWKEVTEQGRRFTMAFNKKFGTAYAPTTFNLDWFQAKCEEIGMDIHRAIKSIGTLGGGNHFIELGRSTETNKMWATIHSGSRQLGQKVANHWQNVARNRLGAEASATIMKAIEHIKKTAPKKEWSTLINKVRESAPQAVKGLEHLEGKDMFGYLMDMLFASAYADENRKVMQEILMEVLYVKKPGPGISSSHNYIDFNDFIIRKGAISAHKGEKMIIPFNMEDGLLFCEGKGNEEWNFSAPHGAGRLFSRTDAKKQAKEQGLGEKTRKRMEEKGIFASKLPDDELRHAYKDPKVIEEAIAPAAVIIDRIKPVIAMKD